MLTRENEPLARWTTLRLGGPARRMIEVDDRDELYGEAAAADANSEPLLVVGGGSNLVIADAGFRGTALRVATRGVVCRPLPGCASTPTVEVTVEAGENWDELVARAVDEGWAGIEALSGIPGTVGAVPIQNVGAYGQDVAETLQTVHAYDRRSRREVAMAAADCGFGYRSSVFKRSPDRYVVGAVTFCFSTGGISPPIRYPELAAALSCAVGGHAPLADVRDAVLGLRRRKGMVLDGADHDTWSVGSFFTNPVLPADRIPAEAPRWTQPDGLVKTSAAWLIEHAGFGRGYGGPAVAVSGKHPLALTNRGDGSTTELVGLARVLRDGVEDRFGIRLAVEPTLVGCSL